MRRFSSSNCLRRICARTASVEHLEVARLGDVVVGAGAEALDHRLAILERREHDERNVAHHGRLLDAPAGLLSAEAGHEQIEQDAVDRLHGEQLERLFARARQDDVVALAAQRAQRARADRSTLSSTARIRFGPEAGSAVSTPLGARRRAERPRGARG